MGLLIAASAGMALAAMRFHAAPFLDDGLLSLPCLGGRFAPSGAR